MAEEKVILKDGGNTGGFSRSKESIEETPAPAPEHGKFAAFQKIFKDTKFLFIFAIFLGIVLFLIAILLFLYSKNSTPNDLLIPQSDISAPEMSAQNDENLKFDMKKMDSMVQKANALYQKGQREQALEVYQQIALYSEALSNYNLGVSQMNQENYAQALESFKDAIASNENQTVSAINAAVCALHLNDTKKFQYYLDLAYVNLVNEGDSPLFDYYLSLINYYKGFYPEALQSFQQNTSPAYSDEAKYLSAKIYTKMGLDERALQNLLAQGNYEVSLPLGLLYARMGEYNKARTALNQAMKIQKDHNKSIAALNLIDLKTGNYADMMDRITKYFRHNERKILDTYKIKVRLNKNLSNIQIAQNEFKKDFLPDKKAQVDTIFYFAPYEVFDALQAAEYINKANVSSYIKDGRDLNLLLSTSKALSSANVRLAKIISDAINNKLHKANADFKKLLSTYAEHSILQYNLALSYAQLQKYDLAFNHFSSAYHLNPKNYLAGAFALLSGSISGKDINRLMNEISENMSLENAKDDLALSIMSFANNNNAAMMSILDSAPKNNALDKILRIIVAKNNGLNSEYESQINALKELLNDDILSNILYFNARNSNLNIKEYAQNAQIYFQNLKLDYKSLAGGALVVRDDYIELMRVSGLLNQEREKIKQMLALSNDDEMGLSSVLAYMDIYAGLYEEAYALYDELINTMGVKDTSTYFLAAVAATGANNPNAAIALLELSRLEDDSNAEARAALGMLYQEVQNYEPALFQYSKVANGTKNKIFTFGLRQ